MLPDDTPNLTIDAAELAELTKAAPSRPGGGQGSPGDSVADDLLLSLYDELHHLAEHRLRNSPPGQTLQATALVHEAYLRMLDASRRRSIRWEGRAHFFFVAARAMRDILVERARRQGARRRIEATEARPEHQAATPPGFELDVEALDAALVRLAQRNERMHTVVMLRVFSGMATDQIAECLGVDERTVQRDWRFARAWLAHEMGDDRAPNA